MSHWENYELIFKKILAIILAIAIFGWMLLEDTEEDEPVLTIEDKCELVLRNPNDTPKDILLHCKNLLKEHDDQV